MDSTHMMLEQLAQRLAAGVGEPVAHRIVEHIWLAVVEGDLPTGSRLPTARQLAIALNVSPRAVERAYRRLEERGVVATRHGEGSFVSLTLPSEEDRVRHREFGRLCRDAIRRARELEFDLDDLIEGLSDYRTLDPTTLEREE